MQDEDGGKVNNKTIFDKIRIKRKPKKGVPTLGGDMGVSVNYFDFKDYPGWIIDTPDNLLITSKLFPSTTQQPLIGGQSYPDEIFSPYIAYVNKFYDKNRPEDKDRVSGVYFVITTPPVPDKKKKGFWVSTVIPCDKNGKEMDLGFDPKNPELSFDELGKKLKDLPKSEKIEDAIKNQPESVSGELSIKQAEVEKEKYILAQKTLDAKADIRDMLKNKIISYDQYKEMIEDLNK